ncbi:hypothetical protein [Pseudomonas sp. NFR16]|uniref:hypothetical protein n=1 Tax=Pseudomonas sp. NFR16 TaxID=1566248 RepID=UPI0008D402AC|nr:hypothetical protein [Pseudomonas sp. NFR16]SEJ50220.1 hypothetical protein SAMN03159495_3468 [Pseudomonas sp. NFR16]
MSRPENTIGIATAQDPLERYTVHQSKFWGPLGREMFQLMPSTGSGDALKEASSLMAGVIGIVKQFIDEPEGASGSVLFAVGFLMESAKALLDGGTYGIEMQTAQGGVQ